VRVINGRRYLSTGEVASKLGVTRQAVHYWIRRRTSDPALRKYLKVHRDSVSGFRFLEEGPILELERNFERRTR